MRIPAARRRRRPPAARAAAVPVAIALLACGSGAAGQATAQDVPVPEASPTAAVVTPSATRGVLVGRTLRLTAVITSPAGVPEGFCRFGQAVAGRWVEGVPKPFRGGTCTGALSPQRPGPQRFRVRYLPFAGGPWAPAQALTVPVAVTGTARTGARVPTRARVSLLRTRGLRAGDTVRIAAVITSRRGAPAGSCRFGQAVRGRFVDGPPKPFRGGRCQGALVLRAPGVQRFRVRYIPFREGIWQGTQALTAPARVAAR